MLYISGISCLLSPPGGFLTEGGGGGGTVRSGKRQGLPAIKETTAINLNAATG